MKKALIYLLLMLISAPAMAQLSYYNQRSNSATKTSGFDKDRLVYGGGLGLGFGNSAFNASIQPILGYKISETFAAGISLGYDYARYKYGESVYNYQTMRNEYTPTNFSMFKAGVWGRAYLPWNLLVQVDFANHFTHYTTYRAARFTNGDPFEKVKLNYNMPTLLVGGGYRQYISERVGIIFLLQYDVLQNSTEKIVYDSADRPYSVGSPYYGRLNYTVGFNIGL